MADIGVPPHIIEAVLNHVKAATRAALLASIIAAPMLPRVAALARWDEHVASIIGADDEESRKCIAA